MYSKYIVLLIAVWLLYSCGGTDVVDSDLEPTLYPMHTLQMASRDGRYIAYKWHDPAKRPSTGIRVLDITTGEQRDIELESKLPSNVKLLEITSVAAWCPYDNTRMLMNVITGTDTIGDGARYEYGQNAYIVSTDLDEVWRVTPQQYGPAGARANFGVGSWYAGSTPEADSIDGGIGEDLKIYVPQQQKLYPASYSYIGRQSPNGNYYAGSGLLNLSALLISDVLVNNRSLSLPTPVKSLQYLSWSPDSKKIVFQIQSTNNKYSYVIADVDRAMKENPAVLPMHAVLPPVTWPQMVYASFLTDSTLVASLQTAPDTPAYLWEVTTKGKIVRQLTFAP